MRDLVEARLDITFQHPLVAVGCQHVDLGDGVMRSTSRTEPIATWVEVRFEDGFEDQLHAGLHDPVPIGGDAQSSELARRLGDHPLLDR